MVDVDVVVDDDVDDDKEEEEEDEEDEIGRWKDRKIWSLENI